MSFRYKGVLCTLNNYSELFGSLSEDFIDEIRLAILDDTQIGGYLDETIKSVDGANKLSQIRKALRDFVPVEFISLKVSAEITSLVRELYLKQGADGLAKAGKYFPKTTSLLVVPEEILKHILLLLIEDIDISRINFIHVNKANIDIIAAGLLKGYPMWLVAEGGYSKEYLSLLVSAMRLGLDIHPFCEEDWSSERINCLVQNADSVKRYNILAYVSPKFDEGRLREIIYAANNHIDFARLCQKDSEGNPLFNEYQMSVLSRAMLRGIPIDEICDWRMSDLEMEKYLESVIGEDTSSM